jgi:hypothetical protein
MTATLHEDQYTFLIILGSVLFRMRNTSGKRCRENQNTHFMFNNVFRNSCCLWDKVEKYSTAGKAIDGNMAYAHCVLGNSGYRHTLGIRKLYCFCTAIMVDQTTLNVTLYAHCLYCLIVQRWVLIG